MGRALAQGSRAAGRERSPEASGESGAAGPATEGGTGARRRAPQRCLWCGREVVQATTVGRRRRYCGQACRQRAYENRTALVRSGVPDDAVVLSAQERDAFQDRLFQLRCAAEDVATAVAERADHSELGVLVEELLRAAQDAEALR